MASAHESRFATAWLLSVEAGASLAVLLEAAPDAMVVTDQTGRIVAVNRHVVDLFGYEVEELVGATVETLVPLRSRDVHASSRKMYQQAPTRRPMRSGYGRRKDGREFPADISLAPLQSDAGALVCASIRDVSDRHRIEEELVHQALHDPLTGLPNRALLVDRADQAIARCRRDGSTVAVLFVGVDRFNVVNDSLGHAGGDAVLLVVAGRLTAAVRPSDTVARFGGDEFVVVCDVAGAAEATAVAARVAEAFNPAFVTEHGEMFLTASVGIATGTGEAENLFRDANTALRRAKDAGRNRTEFFDETMRVRAARRFETTTALHHAVERGELRLLYQPVVTAGFGAVRGVEALLRWDHPKRGRLGPDEFVALAEETGLIVPVGGWVLREALEEWSRWQSARPGAPALTMSVNLSAAQLRQPSLFDTVVGALHQAGAPPEALCLEITESVLMGDWTGAAGCLAALRDLGVSLAIDDFGTGYSSLTYLKRLPVDVVKIDRQFIAGLGVDPSDSAIVAAVIDLAHTLDLVVVAEGVETAAQHSLLRSLGCDLIQGFLFSEALAPPQLHSLLAGTNRALPG